MGSDKFNCAANLFKSFFFFGSTICRSWYHDRFGDKLHVEDHGPLNNTIYHHPVHKHHFFNLWGRRCDPDCTCCFYHISVSVLLLSGIYCIHLSLILEQLFALKYKKWIVGRNTSFCSKQIWTHKVDISCAKIIEQITFCLSLCSKVKEFF